MAPRKISRRDLLAQSAFVAGGVLLLSACTGDANPQPGPSAGPDGFVLPDIQGPTLVTDPAKLPTSYGESPDFASLVKAGKLPPVRERIGQDPLVFQPIASIGKYGGEIRRGYQGVGDFQTANRFCAGPDSLLYWDYQHQNVVPNIAKAYELSDGDRVLTLHLRRGMRWSDGQPFTADDILFWRDDISLNPELSSGSPSMNIKGQQVRVVKVDDYTVQYISPVANPLLPQMLASWTDVGGFAQNGRRGGGGYAPKHYLSKFHPKYTSKAELDKLAAASGVKNWSAFFLSKSNWVFSTELPMLTPWVTTRSISDSPWTLEANPYSIWMDSKGNQLPYIPKITMRQVETSQVLVLKAVAGEYDFQERNLDLASLPVLVKNQEKSGYTVHRMPAEDTLDILVKLNLAYVEDQVVGDLLRTTDFRRALSLGIDRDKINQIFCLGTSVPSAYMVADNSPYFPGPEWRTKWATYDVAQANKLLDGVGLTKRDGDGYRMRPDGQGRIQLEAQAFSNFMDTAGAAEAIKQQWQQIGVALTVLTANNELATELTLANKVMIHVTPASCDDPFVALSNVLPTDDVQGVIGITYAKWYNSGGKVGVEPPDSVRGLTEAMNMRDQGLTASTNERIRLGKEIFKMHADQVWSIGVAGFGLSTYGLYVAKNDLGNVPARMLNMQSIKSPSNALPMSFYHM